MPLYEDCCYAATIWAPCVAENFMFTWLCSQLLFLPPPWCAEKILRVGTLVAWSSIEFEREDEAMCVTFGPLCR